RTARIRRPTRRPTPRTGSTWPGCLQPGRWRSPGP
ncbi:uncharacterized protein METZ01_LOCUS176928, partial [marine metagenome]